MLPSCIKTVECSRITRMHLPDNIATDYAIEEQPITIQIEQIGSFTLLSTPIDLKELAIGFAYAEGIIDSADDILKIETHHEDQLFISLQVKNPTKILTKRNLIVTSGCGLCGKHNIDNLLINIPPCNAILKLKLSNLDSLMINAEQKQILFKKTGATHAAAIFDSSEKIISTCEDIARHSALDKSIGNCLLKNINLKGTGVILSGRISFEIVAKAARAGIEMIIARSAPTLLAIKAAKHWNITLIGFVRTDSGNIYSGNDRIIP